MIRRNYLITKKKVYKNKTNEGVSRPSLAYIFYDRIVKL